MIEVALLSAVGALMLAAASRKLRVTDEFRAAVSSWRVVSPGATRILSRTIVSIELGIGLTAFAALLFVPKARPWVLLAGCLVLVAFATAQAIISRVTPDADCGCFGRPTRVDAWSATRTAGLAAALLIVWSLGLATA